MGDEVSYILPDDITDLFDEYEAAQHARDAAVKGYFRFQVRNAIYLGKIAIQKRREFWAKVYDLYPELDGERLTYDMMKRTVSLKGMK